MALSLHYVIFPGHSINLSLHFLTLKHTRCLKHSSQYLTRTKGMQDALSKVFKSIWCKGSDKTPMEQVCHLHCLYFNWQMNIFPQHFKSNYFPLFIDSKTKKIHLKHMNCNRLRWKSSVLSSSSPLCSRTLNHTGTETWPRCESVCVINICKG